MTDSETRTKQLFKILIGVAWIDGTIQPEERQYLHQLANERGLAGDREIAALLTEAQPVPAAECYTWLREYLGDPPDRQAYPALVERLSALIYSDGQVDTEEAKLLAELQALDPAQQPPKSGLDKALTAIQSFYRRAVGSR
ncbi:MAG: TerB family tellurite resistance protein [Spirulinaceae cyanobacterium SM2_1_0]|nr:TerB family tellurite resistance protein [Spirulinaceae cyanobacterium SM2_1_0]